MAPCAGLSSKRGRLLSVSEHVGNDTKTSDFRMRTTRRTACAASLSRIPLLTFRSAAQVASARPEGGRTAMKKSLQVLLPMVLVLLATLGASAQSFRVQCPTSTITHPGSKYAEHPYN